MNAVMYQQIILKRRILKYRIFFRIKRRGVYLQLGHV